MEAYSKDTYFMNILKQVEAETRILQSREHIQHGTTTVYEHCVQVAYESYLFAKEHQLKVEMEQLIRGALLHDYFLYDWHNQLTPHDIIKKHMFPLTLVPPKYLESWIVCWIDKKCSTRETLQRRCREEVC